MNKLSHAEISKKYKFEKIMFSWLLSPPHAL